MKKIKLNFEELENNYELLLEDENNIITGGYDLSWFIDFYNTHTEGSYSFNNGYVSGYSDAAYTINLNQVNIYAGSGGGTSSPFAGYNFNGTFTHNDLNTIYGGDAYSYYSASYGNFGGSSSSSYYGGYGTGGTTKYSGYGDISTVFGFGTAVHQASNELLTSANTIAMVEAYAGPEAVAALKATATMSGTIMSVTSRFAGAIGVAYNVYEIKNNQDDVHTYVNLAVTGLTVGAEIFIGAAAAPYLIAAGIAYGAFCLTGGPGWLDSLND
jgi:hypothetical protein